MSDAAPGRELVRAPQPLGLTKAEHFDLARVANTLARSGLFPDARTGSEAYAKVLLGRSIGLGPMQAMTGIHIVEGKPQIAATTLAGFVRESAIYDYEVLEHTASKCTLAFSKTETTVTPGGQREEVTVELGESTFSIKEAKDAGLGKWPNEEKWKVSQWGKWPRNMVFARAMSNGVKWYCPDLFGGVPIYTEADEFMADDRAALTAGEGDGEALGADLGADVEAVIARALDVGHAALSNRGAIETVLIGQPQAFVDEWIADATRELDEAQAAGHEGRDVPLDDDEPVEADVLPAEDDAQGWRERSGTFLAAWQAMSEDEQQTDEGLALKHEADTALQTAMNIDEAGGVSVAGIERSEGDGEES